MNEGLREYRMMIGVRVIGREGDVYICISWATGRPNGGK